VPCFRNSVQWSQRFEQFYAERFIQIADAENLILVWVSVIARWRLINLNVSYLTVLVS